ncbi:DUF663-domain-containing protein [Pseudovirgaria hyperparasitica]|uniref:DUF663-domain-containing protein n=1 Tax=Pseudovirgaria hyperparasitica TaxID=470096 RepID=A0A6A6WF78_9PEZI|nr:DUF663-domain-containing protein [Pseudovirgaria hyperparasitica]KAF2760536.1 DUF663-domain-containing protein [Pseudovirgaria hyperparasitica]
MAPIAVQQSHHHRSTTKSVQKAFKSRHASKGALKERSKGKVEVFEKGVRRTPHQQIMSKLDRRNQAKQKRLVNNQEHTKAISVFSGRDGAPRVVALVPLAEDVSASATVKSLNGSLDIEDEVPEYGSLRTSVDRFKQNIQYIIPQRELFAVLDACRTADFVVFILSAEQEVDSYGELLIRSVETQGVSNCIAVAQGLGAIEPTKKRAQTVASLKSYITHFLPTIEKVHSLEASQECLNVVRSLCTTVPKGIRWREDRSWIAVEDVQWPSGKGALTSEEPKGEVIITGVVRGKGLKADRLVQVGDWGDFQIDRIVAAPLDTKKKTTTKDSAMAVDSEAIDNVLERPSEDQDDLDELAPEEVVMEDVLAENFAMSTMSSVRKGVLLDDHHYFDEDEGQAPVKAKRLPRGTSKYQSAWFLDNISDSGSDMEDVDEDMPDDAVTVAGAPDPADGIDPMDFDGTMRDPTEAGPSEYPASEMFLDPAPEDEKDQLDAYRQQRKNEEGDDLEFPDEIELHPNVLARERLARYRGLKSLKTSTWETQGDKPHEPAEWARLLEVQDYRGAKNRVLRETLLGGVQPGTRVAVHLRDVPLSLQAKYDPTRPLGLFSLLRHEHKRTACNYSITLSPEHDGPLRSKSELIAQCGPRRFVINPLFSHAGNTPNDVHKFERFIHPGRSSVASFTGPLTWGAVPVIYFTRTPSSSLESIISPFSLIATGSSLAPSTSRVVAKRIILTGHPYKIHKRLVTVRYMFFNDQDIAWFKALQLWTKRGRSGYIKESLGTHGYFKATFDGKINPLDAVAMSLYKRVWPRAAKALEMGQA